MNDPIGRTGVSYQDLQRYFDGELVGTENQELAAHVEAEPELKAELAQLGLLRALVVESSAMRADAVPAARFEQVWSEVERAIERDARESRGARGPVSAWARVRQWLRAARIPLVAAAGAALVAIVIVRGFGVEDAPAVAEAPTVADPPAPEAAYPSPPAKAKDEVAIENVEVPPMKFGDPKPGDAELHSVEFGGHHGTIAKTGTVTVLYVEEDVEPEDSERSL